MLSGMEQSAPLEFTDEQLLTALRTMPPEYQAGVEIRAMEIELRGRRAGDAS